MINQFLEAFITPLRNSKGTFTTEKPKKGNNVDESEEFKDAEHLLALAKKSDIKNNLYKQQRRTLQDRLKNLFRDAIQLAKAEQAVAKEVRSTTDNQINSNGSSSSSSSSSSDDDNNDDDNNNSKNNNNDNNNSSNNNNNNNNNNSNRETTSLLTTPLMIGNCSSSSSSSNSSDIHHKAWNNRSCHLYVAAHNGEWHKIGCGMGAVKSTYHRYSSLHVVGESTFFFYEVVENIGDIPIEAVEKFLHYLINETLSGLYGHPVHAIHPEAVNIAIQQRQLKNDIPPLARMDMYKEPNAKLNVGANKVDLKDAQDSSVPVNTCADVLAHLKTSPAGVAATNAANEEAETAYASVVADLKVVGGARDYPNTAARDQKSELFLRKAWDNKTEFLPFIRMMIRAVASASNEYLQLHTARETGKPKVKPKNRLDRGNF